jgi:hypothetical protein
MTDLEQIKQYGKLIRQHDQGYTIYYHYREFYAIKETTIIRAETEKELEILIKNHEAELRRFKPIEVFRVEDGVRGRLTSRVADAKDEVYFSFKDASGQSSHSKEPISPYHRWETETRLPKFVEVTPKNLQLMKDMEKEQEAIRSCEAAIEELKKRFEKPVTQETIDKAAGETKD